ncbi:response regulator transcription factor [Pedobacter sp. SYP-B3415]|uniref:response regulator n=1 Tax=Pedobacter sp. SYP-B3415 TaxID=2496641 RepID=UPI00101B8058|nr:response regulator transcription factor [Pedobacter sp. SYP-B3415]
MTRSKKLYIVDDHQLVIDGLCSLLANEPDYELVGSSNSSEKVDEAIAGLAVDILITDVNMPGSSGIELTRMVKKRFPKIKVLALSMFSDTEIIKQMIDSGISGYILKNTGKQELLDALNCIAANGTYFADEVMLEFRKNQFADQTQSRLTNREIEIIRLIEKEYSNKKIATELFISERTVETHRKNIFRKTNTQGIIGLLKYAYEQKII